VGFTSFIVGKTVLQDDESPEARFCGRDGVLTGVAANELSKNVLGFALGEPA
jgi:hypothetical protein